MTIRISNNAAIAGLDAILALLGSGALLRFYTGSAPTNVEDAATGTLLAAPTFSATAFAGATDGTNKASSAANAIGTQNAIASGTAGYWRAVTSGGTGIIQGSVGATGSGEDIELVTTTITSGQPVAISAINLHLPEVGT